MISLIDIDRSCLLFEISFVSVLRVLCLTFNLRETITLKLSKISIVCVCHWNFFVWLVHKDVSVWIIFRISFLSISMIWGIGSKLSWLNSIQFELTQWWVMQGMLCVFSKTVLENFFIYFQLAEFVPCKNNWLLAC